MKIVGTMAFTFMMIGAVHANLPCNLETSARTTFLSPIESEVVVADNKDKPDDKMVRQMSERCRQKMQQYLKNLPLGAVKEQVGCSEVIFEQNNRKYVVFLKSTHDSTWEETRNDKCQKIQECLLANRGERQDLEDLNRSLDCQTLKRSGV
ncbi:MAG: hypothetical protein WCG27_11590 [Pseudomonadota bacterium]